MYTFVHRSAGRTVHIGLTEVSPPKYLPQKLVFGFQWLSLLTKGRNTNREPMHMDADKTAMDEEISEDIWLMRSSCRSERLSKSLTCYEGVYSRVTMILLSKYRFHKRSKDMSVDI